ncbi:MAG: hypothetical protein ACOYJY_02745 [Acutalibacteraceae bacterium]|jgi:hypothetical protein
MQKRLWIRLVGLAAMGGLVLAGFTGCKRNEPVPEPSSSTTTTSKSAATTAPITTTTTTSRSTSAIATTETTQPDPLGYRDLVDAEDWPIRIFNSIEGFVHWVENPHFRLEDNPFEPEKDEHGFDVYKRDFFDALYPNYQRMFAVDRFYMLPDVPDDWEEINMYLDNREAHFYYHDRDKNWYYFAVGFRTTNLSDYVPSEIFAFTKNINGNDYIIWDYDTKETAKKRGSHLATFVNGYPCSICMKSYDPNNQSSIEPGYERVFFTEDSDLTEAISLLKFKRVDLPPLDLPVE